MFSQAKLYLYGGALLVILALAGTAYVYKLKFDKASLERSVAEQQRDTMLEVNRQILAGIKKDGELKNRLYADLKGARDEAEKVKQKLASHDLGKLARAKPGLLTRFARRATKRVLADIEAAANGTAENLPAPAGSRQPAPSPPAADRGPG